MSALIRIPNPPLLLALLLTACCYAWGADGAFIFDSRVALSRNAAVQIDGGDWDDWRVAAQSSSSGPLGRPLTMASFALNHVIGEGWSVLQVKLINTGLHLVTGALIFLFLARLLQYAPVLEYDRGDARAIAWLASAIWLLHPLHVSTVLFAVQRMAQLSAVFVIAGMWTYAYYRPRWAKRGALPGELFSALLTLAALTLLAALSKENGLLLPWLLLIIEVCFFRGQWTGSDRPLFRRATWITTLLPVLVLIVVALFPPEMISAGYASRDFTLWQRLLTEGRVLWQYLAWIVWPDPREMALFHDDVVVSTGLLSPITTLLALTAWVASAFVAVIFRRDLPLMLFALLFYLVAHSMESTVVPLELVYEHRNYLAAIGPCLLLSWILWRFAGKEGRSYSLLVGLLLLPLALTLLLRTNTWSDEWLLATKHAQHHPQSPRAQMHLANAAYRRATDNPSDAETLLLVARQRYEVAYQLDRRNIPALVNLYYLDSVHFPVLAANVDWFDLLLNVAPLARYRGEDRNAVILLTSCLVEALCQRDSEDVLSLYAAFDRATGGHPVVVVQWARYLQGVMMQEQQARELLKSRLDQGDGSAKLLRELILLEYAAGNSSEVINLAARLVEVDRGRRQLESVRTLFGNRGPGRD